MTAPLVLVLPAPPSVNNLFATVKGGRRIRSKRYQAWVREAWLAVQQNGNAAAPSVSGRVSVEMQHERVKRRKDLDNLSKVPIDFLVTMGFIADDSLIESITSRWSDTIKGMQITVRAV